MRTPFTVEQFFDVFASYNVAVWPAPVVAYLLGLLAVVLAFRGKAPSGRLISGVLALFWFWMGLVYHLGHLRRINPAANLFGAFFILQGLLFLIDSYRGGLSFRPRQDPRSLAGAVLIIYSMLGYPLIGQARSVILVDKAGKVRYIQVVPELSHLPDMEAAFKRAEELNRE